jgi:hypothetical protein
MFTPDFYIDSFQSTKRMLTNKVITDATLNKAAHNYIDAQTAFAKMLAANTVDMVKYSVDSVSKVLFPQEVVKAKTTKASKAEAE